MIVVVHIEKAVGDDEHQQFGRENTDEDLKDKHVNPRGSAPIGAGRAE